MRLVLKKGGVPVDELMIESLVRILGEDLLVKSREELPKPKKKRVNTTEEMFKLGYYENN